MAEMIWIGAGAVLGAWARYFLGLWAFEKWGGDFAYGTLIINITGSFVMAFILYLHYSRGFFPSNLRLFLTVGFCATYTTFSTFSWDTMKYLSEGNYKYATLNIFFSVFGCLFGTGLGLLLAKLF
jgi:CrcB protein